ncbi:MAG: hypothetical protein QOE90_1103 [Thermoplasmata archaeon]|jgi:hypothetical protein|nr:hypothetical protein [Thermoplasmata archaeon]
MTWTCPKCGRSFAREGQSHSCRPTPTLASHFEKRPPWMREAFDRIVAALPKGARVEAVGNGIHVVSGSTYAGIKPMAKALRVEFLWEKPLASPRVVKSERFSATRHAHHVDLLGSDDVDAELVGWLAHAHKLRA